MSVTSAMFTGVSGLLNMAEGINVVGNNISNVNTIGFKGARTLFSDTLAAQISGGEQVGRGVQIQKVESIFSQGVTQGSEKATDIALQGNGFFALGRPGGNMQVTDQSTAYLTRAGAFSVDSNRYLVNPDGYQVLDTNGNPIRFNDNSTQINTVTAAFNTGGTTGAAIAAMQADLPDIQALITAMPAGSAQNTAQAIYDAANTNLTNAQTLNDAFVAAPVQLLADTAAKATTATNAAILAYQDLAKTTGFTIPVATSTANSTYTTAYTTVQTEVGKAFSHVVGIDDAGVITYAGKDGNVFLYDSNSTVGAAPTDANRLLVDRIAIIKVNDPSALTTTSGTLFKSTVEAGIPATLFSKSSNGANATTDKVIGNSLEQSNVDMATEFVKMILTQRAYSANSKTITTADEMTQEVLNLKR